jgi:hypothetical protein
MRAVSLIFRISAMFAMSTLVAAFPSFSSAFSGATQPRTAAEPEIKTIIWQDPGAVEELDFVAGPGGVKKVPTPPFTFDEETLSGSNPKVKVKDANDTTWHVKWGSEVNAEVFATRMAWAAGYFVDPSYFIASGKIEGAKGLKRAKKFVNSDGSFTNARFERHKKKGATFLDDEKSWRWDQNPLVGTPELNGLKIMLMLTSNWDNKDVRDIGRGSNTAILEYQDGENIERRYMVTDWGGSMGKWGGVMGREKWDPKGYEKQTADFIKGVERGFVEFGYSGQHTGTFKEGISVNDVKWLMGYVGRITDQQIRDGLKASGATPDEIDRFARSIRNRIDQMRKLT